MAEATARNLEGDQAKFESQQLAALNALHATNPDVVDLTAVEAAGIITAETRTKIEAAVPNHELLFQRAVAKERREAGSEVAYRRAFQAIYGRFLLEQGDSDLEKPSGPVMKALGQVLKFQLTAEGLRGRSELRAAVRYLRLSRVTNQQSQALLAEQTTLNGQITSLEPDALALSTAAGAFAEFDDLRTRIRSLPTTPGSPETLACFTEISGVVDAIQNLKDAQVAGIEAAYQAILRKSDWVENNNYPAAMVQDLFIAVGNWKVRIESASTQKNNELNQAREQLTTVNQNLTALGGNVLAPEDVIKEAFSGIDPLKIIELEREHTEAQSKLEGLSEQYKHFSGKGPAEIHEKFSAIKTKNVTSGDVRKKESKFKEAEANKAKLEQLKESFSDAKTSSVLDLFQELSALRSGYEAARAEADLDSRIAAESSSVSILESQLTAEFTAKKKQKSGNRTGEKSSPDDRYLIGARDKTEDLKATLEKRKLEIEKLKKRKTDLDKFKEFAKKLRGELQRYCRDYLTAFELGQGPTKPDKATVEDAKKRLDAINIEKGVDFSELETIYENLRSGFGDTFKTVKARLEEPDLALPEKQAFEDEKSHLDKAKALHADLKPIVERLRASRDLGITIGVVDLNLLVKEFEDIKIENINFEIKNLTDFYTKYFSPLFETPVSRKGFLQVFETRLAELKDEVKNKLKAVNIAKTKAESNENLTDAQAAKKIIVAIVAEQYPDMSLEDQQKTATAILANDVATLQTEASYEELAKRASAELLDTVSQVGFKEKLIGLRYKDGEKTEQPFKDLKPENFKDWASIEKLFTIGRLNHQNGFLVLAALEIFDGDVRSVQSVRTERKLKELLAKQLGVDERMDEAGVNKIVNDAFKDQMKKVRPLVASYFSHYDTNASEWSGNKVKELNLRYEKLREERNLGKIGEDIYGKRMAELVKEATEANIMSQVDFSQDSVMAGYWDSPEAQWLRDRGHDVGKYAGHKALALGKGGLRVAGRALLGTAGLASSLAVHTALLPFRVAKYPLMIATKPLVGLVNLFRRNKWQPFSIVGSVRTDLGRVGGYFSGKASGVWTGSQEAFKAVPEELGHAKYEGKKYKDRTMVDMAALEAEAKELKEKAEATPIVIAGSPFIDFQKYKDQVAKLDRILAGGGGGGSSGGGAAKKEAA